MTSIASITLEVPDVTVANAFYATAFGLGSQVGLRASEAETTGFRAFTLSLVVSQPANVDELIGSALEAGATTLKLAKKGFWGYGGVLRAPDGTIWKVATSSKKNTGPATRQVDDIVLLLGVADVAVTKRFYVDHGLEVTRSFGRKYVEFRRTVEGSVRNSFTHSLLAKGRLLYTHDQTIAALCARLGDMGDRDSEVQLLRAATAALPPIYKAHKWFVTRGDLDYTALWILYAATPLAQVEVIRAGLLVDREVIPQAVKLNPAFFRTVYADLLNTRKRPKAVKKALDAIDDYVNRCAAKLFRPVLDHMREVGEARSSTEIEAHFQRNFDIRGVTTACEYLADQGLLGKAATPARLTKKSNVEVQELAFFHTGGPPDGF